jgi:phosphoglycerate kinase
MKMINKFKTLDDFDFNGKLVLLRCDLNSDVRNGKVVTSDRIKESAKTISELRKKNAKVVVIAHQGRPGKKDFISLKQHAKLLSKFTKVKFVKDVIGRRSISEIENLKTGEAVLLENVRELKEEFDSGKKKNKFIEILLDVGFDIYINDAFSVSHREQTSVTGFPRYIMEKGIGRVMEKELKALEKLGLKNCLYILGGAKPEDNVKLLNKNNIFASGFFDHLCLIAKGYELGKQREFLKDNLKLIPQIKKNIKKIKTSVDFIVRSGNKVKVVDLNDLPVNSRLYDIGPKTLDEIKKEINKYKFVFMKGPVGLFQEKEFSVGTVGVLKALAKHKGKVILGGGHLNTALEQYKINKKSFEHISLAGGALIQYLAGEKLPGLEVLKFKVIKKRKDGKKI